MSTHRAFDRAAVVTTAILCIIATVSTKEQLRQEIEACLRDEFADLEHRLAYPAAQARW